MMKKYLPLIVIVGLAALAWYLLTPSGDPVVPPEGGPAVPVSPARRIARAVTEFVKPPDTSVATKYTTAPK